MTDELTPEEREALKSLPRERMPSAGLEDRVVAAMHERGVLAPARRARVIRITTGRVAGLVAAGVALMIGAYSIGLHRGSFRPDVRETLEPRTAERTIMNEVARPEAPATPGAPSTSKPEAGLSMQSRPEPGATEEAPAEKLEWKLKDTETGSNVAESTAPDKATDVAPAPAQQFARELDATAKKALEARPAAPQSLAADEAAPMMAKANERTYRLGTTVFMIDAPDSVRVTGDATGQVLSIASAGGDIRILPADTRGRTDFVPLNRVAPKGSSTREVRLDGHVFRIDAPVGVRIEEDAREGTLLIRTPDGIVRIRLAD